MIAGNYGRHVEKGLHIIVAVIGNCIEKDTRITSNCNNCYGIK